MNRIKTGTIALSAAALIALGCGVGDTSGGGKPISKPSTSASASTSVAAETSTQPAAPTYVDPKPADIKLTVKILEKQCFGSAGCLVDFRISKLTYSKELDPSATYEVTYTYKGLKDPVENRLTLNGSDGTFEVEETESGQTKTSAAKITAVVTDVEKM